MGRNRAAKEPPRSRNAEIQPYASVGFWITGGKWEKRSGEARYFGRYLTTQPTSPSQPRTAVVWGFFIAWLVQHASKVNFVRVASQPADGEPQNTKAHECEGVGYTKADANARRQKKVVFLVLVPPWGGGGGG